MRACRTMMRLRHLSLPLVTPSYIPHPNGLRQVAEACGIRRCGDASDLILQLR